jgi:hypothetical protein
VTRDRSLSSFVYSEPCFHSEMSRKRVNCGNSVEGSETSFGSGYPGGAVLTCFSHAFNSSHSFFADASTKNWLSKNGDSVI